MQLGAWRSFEELEETLTLPELFEIEQGIIEKFKRDHGIEDKPKGHTVDVDQRGPIDRINKKIRERQGKPTDVDVPKGIGYKTIGGGE